MSTSRSDLALFKGIWPRLWKIILDPPRLKGLIQWLFHLWVRGGIRAIIHARKVQIANHQFATDYVRWIQLYDQIGPQDESAIWKRLRELSYQPLISIVMPVYNVEERWLRKAVDSVLAQYYPHWELCIADDCSPSPHIRKVLDEYSTLDSRIRVKYRTTNGHISESSNTALEMARGEFTALLDHDDELRPHALYCVVEELNLHPEADLLYSDEDKIDSTGYRYNPHFKSGWNLDLFFSLNLVTHLAVFRTSLLKKIGGFRKGYEGSQDYDLICRVLRHTDPMRIRHIPFILYHWRAIPGSTALRADEKNYAVRAARLAIASFFTESGIQAKVVRGFGPLHRAIYDLPEPCPKVSLVMLQSFQRGVQATPPISVRKWLSRSGYPKNWVEVLNVDSPSPDAANRAVRASSGDVIVFLNSRLKPIGTGWLRELVSHASRPEIGAVGAKIYYPDDTIQHGGIILGPDGIAGIAHEGQFRYFPADQGRAVCLQSVAAVEADCLAIRRSAFEEVGGFGERELQKDFLDVDLCLKLLEKNYRILWTPFAEFYLQGVPLSDWRKSQQGIERKIFCKKWSNLLSQENQERYYSPNFSLNSQLYSLAFPPRVKKPWALSEE